MSKIGKTKNSVERVGLPPFDVLNRNVLNRMLNTEKPVLPFAARAIIRTQLGMPAEVAAPPAVPAPTNAPPISVTNSAGGITLDSAAK
ncbi:MAG: hypothetical protein WDN00_16065 [Limisphaerales bacterium]